MLLAIAYLIIGAVLGGCTVFFCNNKCPTWGELIVGIGIAAAIWPLAMFLVALAGFIKAGTAIGDSRWGMAFKRWLHSPICKKSA